MAATGQKADMCIRSMWRNPLKFPLCNPGSLVAGDAHPLIKLNDGTVDPLTLAIFAC